MQFAQIATGFQVENRFLGAVGALYGLLALMKVERERAAMPDIIVFEYCLNDILLFQASVLDIRLLSDTLEAVADFCVRHGIALVFLNLHPFQNGVRRDSKAKEKVSRIYRAVAMRRNIHSLWLCDIVGRSIEASDYADQNHFSESASAQIAKSLKNELNLVLRHNIAPGSTIASFIYASAKEARVEGPVARRRISSSVFEGDFLEISRGGRSYWPGKGNVAALMLQSNSMSGDYTVRADKKSFRKRACSQMQAAVPNLMLLHYVRPTRWVQEKVEISMPAREADLHALPADHGALEAVSAREFQSQTLCIHGVMFWTHRPVLSFSKNFVRMVSRASQILGVFWRDRF